MNVAIITSSDRCARGEAVDESGAVIAAFCEQQGWSICAKSVTPDDRSTLTSILCWSVDERGADLVLTTGGTGLSPRDVTPEATGEVIDRPAPGIAEALRAQSLKVTPFAMLSRGIAGLRGKALIINLPGSPKAVRECLEVLRPVLSHAMEMIAGGGH